MPSGPSASRIAASIRLWVDGRAGEDDEEDVDLLGHRPQVAIVAVGDVGARGAGVIDDRHLHRIEPAGDRHADAAEPDDADGAVAEGRRGQPVVRLGPAAGTEVALGGGQFAHRHQEEAEGGVGDFLGEHIRRVGDDDAALGAGGEVDAVIADAETGDDLEIGQAIDQGAVDVDVGAAGDRPDGGGGAGDGAVDLSAAARLERLEQAGEGRIGSVRQLAEGQDGGPGHVAVFSNKPAWHSLSRWRGRRRCRR